MKICLRISRKTIAGIICLALVVVCFSHASASRYRPVANHGYQDLSFWDFNNDGIVNLDGTWEFYWNRLYTPLDFKNDSMDLKPYFLKVPGVWNDLELNSESLPGKGFGTYYLRIKLNQKYDNLGIKILDFSSAYKIWVNDIQIAECGNVSSNLSEIKPQMVPQVITFDVNSDQIVLIVQIANNFHQKGGMWESIRMGIPNQVIAARERSMILTMFFAGTLLILLIYNLWIYLFRKKEKAALWFGILCFFVFIRSLQVNERVIYYLFPNLNLNISYRIEYIILFTLIPISFTLYYYYLFEKSISKMVLKVIAASSFIIFAIVFLSPTMFYTSLVFVFQAIIYALFIYFFFITFNQVASHKKGARLLLISWFVILLGGINDILYLNLIINTSQVSHYAFFIFLVVQAYILSYKLALAYNSMEDMSINLEYRVAERTRELHEEKKKADNLLLNILPVEVANELKQTGRSKAKTFSMVTVMFTDFKDFTRVSENESAELLVSEIDYCFSGFDNIIQKYGIEKIKTVGDAYICAGGLPVLSYTHAYDTINAALEIRDFMLARKAEKEARGEMPFEMRIGIHTGPVVAGIVGIKKFAYDIWGDTVNIAARMESSGEAGKVNISGTTYELVKGRFICTYRGRIQAKNKGEIDMYFIEQMPSNAGQSDKTAPV